MNVSRIFAMNYLASSDGIRWNNDGGDAAQLMIPEA